MTKERYDRLCDRWLIMCQLPLLGMALVTALGFPLTILNVLFGMFVVPVGVGVVFVAGFLAVLLSGLALVYAVLTVHNAYLWLVGRDGDIGWD